MVCAALREFDVYDQNRSPAESVDLVQAQLVAAAEAFERAYDYLSAAQTAINLQGVNTDDDEKLIRRPRLQAVDSTSTFTQFAPYPHEGSVPGTWTQVSTAHQLGLLSDEEYESVSSAVHPPTTQ